MSQVRLYEGPAPTTPPSGVVTLYAKTDGRFYFKADDGVEIPLKPVGAGTGDLLADGTVPLTANWDVGAYTITALRFVSDVPTGTAPFTVASTTLVANLNADLLDGNEATAFATAAQGALADTAVQPLAIADMVTYTGTPSDNRIATWSADGVLDSDGNFIWTGTYLGVNGNILLTGNLLDSNQNELLKTSSTVSAVNEITLTNAATGTAPKLQASGDDTNIDLSIQAKGTGNLLLGTFTLNADQSFGASEDGYALAYNHTSGEIELQNVAGGAGGMTPQFKNEAYTALASDKVYVDCSGGAVTITLPATPATGVEVMVLDSSGDAATNNVTVARNGETIDGVAADFVIDLNYGSCAFAYSGTDWKINPTNGVS